MKDVKTRRPAPFRPPLVDPSCRWFANERSSEQSPYIVENVDEARSIAKDILVEDIKRYIRAKGHERTDFEWLLSVRHSGTRKDHLSSLLVTLEDSPVHNLESFRILVDQLSSEQCKHKDVFEVTEPLCQLLVSCVLPDRKLYQLNVRPLNKEFLKSCLRNREDKRTLLLWYFEDELKKIYGKFVAFLQSKLASSPFDKVKKHLLGNVQFLLCNKPENEGRLLSTLVDKIGDPESEISGLALRLIRKLLEKHPPMKVVVVPELERIIFRKNIQARVQHYALSALSQIELLPGDQRLCEHLIDCYLSLFKIFAATGQEVPTRLMSNLLMGMRLAFPHCADTLKLSEENLHALFTIIHSSQFGTAMQALMLLLNVIRNRPEIADRFFSALYQRMISEDIMATRQGEMFLKLLFNALRDDTSAVRQKAFLKRLSRICLNSYPSFAASALVLCSSLCRINPELDILSPEKQFEDLDEDTSNTKKPGSWVLVELVKKPASKCEFDDAKRNPLYSKANYTCCFELLELQNHYHPTVASFAKTLLQADVVRYETNPFEDLKFTSFLDRLAYRNTEKRPRKGQIIKELPSLNSGVFHELKEEEVPVDERYLHRYLKLTAKAKTKKIEEGDEELEMDKLFDEHIRRRFGLKNFEQNDPTDFASFYRGKSKKRRDFEDDNECADDRHRLKAKAPSRKRSKRSKLSRREGDDNDDEFPDLVEEDFELSGEEVTDALDYRDFKRTQHNAETSARRGARGQRPTRRSNCGQHNKRRKIKK